MTKKNIFLFASILFGMTSGILWAQLKTNSFPVGMGWAKNSVNVVKFRKNAITTHIDNQYLSYYDSNKRVILAKRKLGSSQWEIKKTSLEGNPKDAHNAISIALDGDGYLHLAWNHHNVPLHYQKSPIPQKLTLAPAQMIGTNENRVTYPEFHNLPNGNLLFLYRDGSSGNGNLVVNLYETKKKKWRRLHHSLIDGEGKRNAYWQATVDTKGVVHLSWVWRESPDVASNHDILYARSYDSGHTWVRSDDIPYSLPINAQNAERAWPIAQNSSLMNQTDMTTDAQGNPYIANYWKESDGVQYRVVYHDGTSWKKRDLPLRQGTFDLSGGGTKKSPISRPSVLIDRNKLLLLYRDEESGSRVFLAVASLKNNQPPKAYPLSQETVNDWEPNYDSILWQKEKKLHIFTQRVQQVDHEGIAKMDETLVHVITLENRF
ncbi:MAG: BNR repeat-containing protein [Flavobacteriaceae bacterium]